MWLYIKYTKINSRYIFTIQDVDNKPAQFEMDYLTTRAGAEDAADYLTTRGGAEDAAGYLKPVSKA